MVAPAGYIELPDGTFKSIYSGTVYTAAQLNQPAPTVTPTPGGGQTMQTYSGIGQQFTAGDFPAPGSLGAGTVQSLSTAYYGSGITVEEFINSMSPELQKGILPSDVANMKAAYPNGIPPDAAFGIAQRAAILSQNPNYNVGGTLAGVVGGGDPYNVGKPAGVVPAGGTVYSITMPDGTRQFYVTYQWEGIEFGYRIGTDADFQEIFGAAPSGVFGSMQEVTQAQFDSLGILELGTVDEILGKTESIGSTIYQQLKTYGFEALPQWIRDDPQALFISAQGAIEGWSSGRTLRELSGLASFQARFGAWQRFMDQAGGDELAAMAAYTAEETQLATAIRRYRGPEGDTSTGYLAQVMNIGWMAEQVVPLLAAEAKIKADPSFLDDLNNLLAFGGMQPIGNVGAIALVAAGNLPDDQAQQILASVDLTQLLNGNDPLEAFDLINDAQMVNALEEAGVRNLDLGFVRQLRNDTGGLVSADAVVDFAQTAATNVLRFSKDIDLNRYGLSEEDIVAQVAGRAGPSGKTAGENLEIMNRILRERQQAAGGFEAMTGFQDARGRLVVPGLRGL